jgi:hypothetical protein
MKSMQEEMRTHGAKMDTEMKAIRDKLDIHQEKTDRPRIWSPIQRRLSPIQK